MVQTSVVISETLVVGNVRAGRLGPIISGDQPDGDWLEQAPTALQKSGDFKNENPIRVEWDKTSTASEPIKGTDKPLEIDTNTDKM
ncbi:unnamed protein product [Phytophthora fragariaefolia]|uniref:Unnamed protein product n=1 Tax=Phytophthora fragariaefolia TaxID=1490495 RepID=A0A9W7D9N9_9STRA|nr:unnamed protein product [Phytophthora fragariaefolia]